jgi:hypothetical protein
MRVAVEPDNELDRAVTGAAAATRTGDLGFPIALFLVKAAKGFAALGDRRPWLICARRRGDETAGGNRDLAML